MTSERKRFDDPVMEVVWEQRRRSAGMFCENHPVPSNLRDQLLLKAALEKDASAYREAITMEAIAKGLLVAMGQVIVEGGN